MTDARDYGRSLCVRIPDDDTLMVMGTPVLVAPDPFPKSPAYMDLIARTRESLCAMTDAEFEERLAATPPLDIADDHIESIFSECEPDDWTICPLCGSPMTLLESGNIVWCSSRPCRQDQIRWLSMMSKDRNPDVQP